MATGSLRLLLQTQHAPGQYLLTSDVCSYPLDLRSDTLSDYLRRLRSVLVGGSDPSGALAPSDLLREIGVRLWRALLPDMVPVEARDALAHALRQDDAPLLLTLPPA